MEHDIAERIRVRADQRRRLVEHKRALDQARSLAVLLHDQHFPEVTQWQPDDNLLGIILQIDNMTSVLIRPESDTPATPSDQSRVPTVCDAGIVDKQRER